MIKIDSKIPEGPVAEKWTNYKAHQKLVNPANKRRLDIIVVGTGLAGASAAASLGEMGFRVFNFCIQDSPRRAHSIAAQGTRPKRRKGHSSGRDYEPYSHPTKNQRKRKQKCNCKSLSEPEPSVADLRKRHIGRIRATGRNHQSGSIERYDRVDSETVR